MLENYLKYLAMLNEKLSRFFISQKPYIFCKPGCSKCCENAQYPYTQIEFELLKIGFNSLPFDKKEIISKNIEKTLELKKQNKENKFTYVCPFLIDNMCSIYPFRGIICRTFGLMNVDKDSGSDIPFCAYDGLNYSNVFDKEKRIISKDMYKKLNVQEEPCAYHIRYEELIDPAFAKGYGFEFGEVKPLINWFES